MAANAALRRCISKRNFPRSIDCGMLSAGGAAIGPAGRRAKGKARRRRNRDDKASRKQRCRARFFFFGEAARSRRDSHSSNCSWSSRSSASSLPCCCRRCSPPWKAPMRIQCMNNMKQINMAMQSYESQMRMFPFNWGVLQSSSQLGTAGTGQASTGTCGTPGAVYADHARATVGCR